MNASGSADAALAQPSVELVQRLDYQPWPFKLERLELHFELDAQNTIVTSRMWLRHGDGASGEQLNLMGRSLALLSVKLDGVELGPAQYVVDGLQLKLAQVPQSFELELVTRLAPAENRSGKGLFELEGSLVTHMEPQGMSRVSYFPDRPDVLASYRVTLVADAARYPVLLSNGNRISARDLSGGRHEVVWDDPHPKPCYIFAIVAGDLACLAQDFTTASGREMRIALYAPQRYIAQCDFAMQALQRAMRWDEQRYGLECDVQDYQVVALPGFPGAQENKGLNLFDLSGIVADPHISTDDEALTIERIIAHEYFHNWTGNRVTCRDWFQLSLKEGLTRFRDQCYLEELLGAGVYRIDTVRTLARNQFPEDDGPARHAIRPENYAEVEQFYTATVYEKGAEVIRMLQQLLGPQRFIAGVRAYLDAHDGQAVTTEDFVRAMEGASGADLAQFRRWYAQPGRPLVSVQRAYDAAAHRLTLTLTQSLPIDALAEPLHIPVRFSLLARAAAGVGATGLIELRQACQSFEFEGVAPDTVPSLLEGLSAPVSLAPFLSSEEQCVVLERATDPYARWNAAQQLMLGAVRELAAAHHAGRSLDAPPALLATLASLLARGAADPLLCAELLRVPDEPALSAGLAQIDVDGHAAARRALRCALGQALRPALLAAVHASAKEDPALMNSPGMGRRRLAAVCLDLLMASGNAEAADLCLQRVLDGATMTERFDALGCLVDYEGAQRDQALDAFYDRWKQHPTVVSKWFAAQALCRSTDALQRVMALQSHPAFDINNLNLVMAYYGSFFRQNRVAFHDPSGAGYRWLAEVLLISDRMARSGGAAWLTPQLAQWQRHGPVRQALMLGAMDFVLAAPDISNGLRGMVQRLRQG